MKIRKSDLLMQNKVFLWLALATGLILAVPLVAMQFDSGVDWSLLDFATMGILLFGSGLLFVLVARQSTNFWFRAGAAIAAGTALLLVWANLVVGLIGSEHSAVNLTYLGVLAIGFIGALISRLEPQGMARVMFITAIAQALIAAIGLLVVKDQVLSTEGSWPLLVSMGANGFFVVLWIVSALLFRRSGTALTEVSV